MIPTTTNSTALLSLAIDEGLYQDLMQQLKKDFELSGLSFDLKPMITTSDLLEKLQQQIKQLIHSNFDAYLQLLYRVDIPEKMMQSNDLQDSDEIARRTTFLILQREWKKVYFRKKYS